MPRTTFPRTTFPRKLERRERGPGLADEAKSSAGWPIKPVGELAEAVVRP